MEEQIGNDLDAQDQQISRCLCGSGLDANACCQFPERTALNAPVFAEIINGEAKPRLDVPVTPEIKQALAHIQIPDLFPAQLNVQRKKLYFVKMTPNLYRESVFLDPQRVKASCVLELDLRDAENLLSVLPLHASSYIFHTAFCGSTLLAKVLDALYQCLPLREPDLLGNVYMYVRQGRNDSASLWLDLAIRLLSRRYQENERALIKANDYANPMMQPVLSGSNNTPVLFMYSPVEEFYVACVKAESRQRWLSQRVKSIESFLPEILPHSKHISLEAEDYACLAALYWSYNVRLYQHAYAAFPSQCRSLNFTHLLASPERIIHQCAQHLCLQKREHVDEADLLSQLFGSYSKNASQQYSPELRNLELKNLYAFHSTAVTRVKSISQQLLDEAYGSEEVLLEGALT